MKLRLLGILTLFLLPMTMSIIAGEELRKTQSYFADIQEALSNAAPSSSPNADRPALNLDQISAPGMAQHSFYLSHLQELSEPPCPQNKVSQYFPPELVLSPETPKTSAASAGTPDPRVNTAGIIDQQRKPTDFIDIPHLVVCDLSFVKRILSHLIPGYYAEATILENARAVESEIPNKMKINILNFAVHQQDVHVSFLLKSFVNTSMAIPIVYQFFKPLSLVPQLNSASAMYLLSFALAGVIACSVNKIAESCQYNSQWQNIYKKLSDPQLMPVQTQKELRDEWKGKNFYRERAIVEKIRAMQQK